MHISFVQMQVHGPVAIGAARVRLPNPGTHHAHALLAGAKWITFGNRGRHEST